MEKKKIILELPPILISNEGETSRVGNSNENKKHKQTLSISVAGKHNTRL